MYIIIVQKRPKSRLTKLRYSVAPEIRMPTKMLDAMRLWIVVPERLNVQ